MEHHANIVPWHFLRERQGVVLKWVDIEPDGSLDPEKVLEAVGPRTRLIAVTHMSNVLGTVVDVKTICTAARALGVPVLVDGSQAAVHLPVDVADIGCDFYVITGHKLYGPTGSGALYARRERLAEMRPFLGGGDMIREVRKDAISYADPPLKMEAGTPGIVQTIGLGVALDYMTGLGMDSIAAHERSLRDYASARFEGLNWLNIQGKAPDKGAIFSFTLRGAGASARHLDGGRPQGRRGARRASLRAAADDASRADGDLPGLVRALQHHRGGGRAGGRAGDLPRAVFVDRPRVNDGLCSLACIWKPS